MQLLISTSRETSGEPIGADWEKSGRSRFSAKAAAALLAVISGLGSPAGSPAATAGNDYPTEAVADYVFACMKANGETREALAACSCSADVVASIVPYERYVEASTFLSMMQLRGEGSDLFRSTAEAHAAVQDLRRAQAEGEIRCFRSAN
jgi:hypothetical protein